MSGWMQDCVREFHVAIGQPAPDTLDLDGVRCELRGRLLVEEAIETVEALGFTVNVTPLATYGGELEGPAWRHTVSFSRVGDPDWPAVVDGLCDLVYIALGTAVEAGFPLGTFFAEVHRSNMTKVGGAVRDDGKLLKPDTFEAPRIEYLWGRLVNRASKGLKTR